MKFLVPPPVDGCTLLPIFGWTHFLSKMVHQGFYISLKLKKKPRRIIVFHC